MEFNWDDANVEHIAEHNLEPQEVEEVFYNRNIPAPAYDVPGETRLGLIGATDAGRILYVVYTKRSGGIRIVTARDAKTREKRRYRR